MREYHEERRVGRVDYRNASYEGEMSERRRDGFGMLITDETELIIGTNLVNAADWQLNLIEGSYCYISREVIAYGTIIGR